MVSNVIGERCTGCTACKCICPKNAVSMQADQEGFLRPRVDEKTCVECGLCEKVCPVLAASHDSAGQVPTVYAGWNLDEETRINSSSGGIFPALAQAILDRNGIVIGAAYDGKLDVKHVLIESESELARVGQSKYVQSDPEKAFVQIRRALKENRDVLFCGTPCQVAGLRRYIGGEDEHLYCCDFVCHGVISPKVYRKYLTDVGRTFKSKPVSIQFKNKEYGWNRFSTKISMEDGSVYQKDRNEDRYTMGYTKHHLYLRPSCHQCEFRTIPRQADISLADFWGIGKIDPKLDDEKGTSAILINTPKGQGLFEQVREQLYLKGASLEDLIAGNQSVVKSPPVGEFRAYFFQHMDHCRFDKLIDRIEEKSWHLTPKDKVLRELHLAKLKLKGLLK